MQERIALDFCCNIGQAGLGIHQAGFRVAAAYDVDLVALEAHRVNHPLTKVSQVDLGQGYSTTLVRKHLNEIEVNPDRVDLIWCSPPCQAFSQQGKRDKLDPRRNLYCRIVRTAIAFMPNAIIVENVSSIKHHGTNPVLHEAVKDLEENGYNVVSFVDDAQNFGVAQRRKRHFLVATHRLCRRADTPTHSEDKRTVRDAFAKEYFPRWKPTKHSAKVRSRFSAIAPGDRDEVGRHVRLKWDDVAPTLTAGTRYGSGRNGLHTPLMPIHPEEDRVITVEEAMRLQGVPDNFCLHRSKALALHFLGEGVPPAFAQAIASIV